MESELDIIVGFDIMKLRMESKLSVNREGYMKNRLEELRKQREDIGMIFQHFNLLMQKSVIDNVCFPLYILRLVCLLVICPESNVFF